MCNMRMNNKVSKQQAHKKGHNWQIQIDILFAFHLMTDDKRQPADNRRHSTAMLVNEWGRGNRQRGRVVGRGGG